MGDDPFAEDGDAGDYYNPFSDEMFDGKAKGGADTTAPTAQAPANPSGVPDWATSKDEKKAKSVEKAKPKAAPPSNDFHGGGSSGVDLQAPAPEPATEAVSLEDEPDDTPVPEWAVKKAEKKPATKKAEAKAISAQPKPSQRVKSDLQTASAPTQDPNAPLLAKDPNFRPANFPAFSKNCKWPFKPCFHHDFKGEIPQWGYSTTRYVYYIWWLNCFALVWNLICLFAVLASSSDNTSVETALIGLLLVVCLIPCSYYCWFHSLYTAMRKDSSMRFGCFFLFFFIQMGTSVLFAAGIPGVGSVGIITAADSLKNNKVVGIMCCVAMSLWIILACLQFVGLQRVLLVFRRSGHSVEQMRQEATVEAGKAGYQAAKSDVGKSVAKAAWET